MTVLAFAVAATIFVTLLVAASFTVSTVSSTTLKPLRMTGPSVKRFGGFVLLFVGVWFTVLAFLPSPIIGA